MASSDLPLHALDQGDSHEEALALWALGEPPDAAVRRHIESCPACQAELAALRRTVQLGREGLDARIMQALPSPAIWTRIAAEALVATGDTDEGVRASHTRAGSAHSRRRRVRQVLLAALAAAALAVAGILVGYQAGRDSGPHGAQTVVALARLAPTPGAPAAASGEVSLRQNGHGPQLFVETTGLPAPAGFYEVWLLNPQTNTMVPIGTLARDGTATLPLPPGLDVRHFHVVDISAQQYDGDPTHQASVLRGALVQ